MKIPIWFCEWLNKQHVMDMRVREFAWKAYQKGCVSGSIKHYGFTHHAVMKNTIIFAQNINFAHFCGKRIKVKERA